jgi:spermidine/putrescine transport system ATP-binding protein
VTSPQPAISLQGVAKSYGRQPALHELDLDIAEGEFFCLLGPSGCGKTTTLNIIGGFVAPSAGAVYIRGARVDELPPHRRDVNTVFQSYALFPHMSVGANIGFGLRMAGVAREEARRRVRAAIEMVGLEGLDARLPLELSGGQQQRVAVARALVNRPAVLLLDEPLGALDLKLRKRLQIELAQIHREVGTVFVYVTHDQEEALALSDRIAVMREADFVTGTAIPVDGGELAG